MHSRAIVALSIMTCQMEEMRRLIGRLRSDYGSKVTVLAGGPHVTACAEEVLDAGADVAFRGEAELSFPAVLRSIAGEREIRGVQSSPDTVCLDSFLSISPKRGMFGPIEITRGCAFACSYCQTSHIFGVKLRHRSIDSIVRQAAGAPVGQPQGRAPFVAQCFFLRFPRWTAAQPAGHARSAGALRKAVTASARISFAHFPSEARPEHITPETLDLLKEFADNDEIVIGAQSGSRRMLEACHRSHTVENVLAAVAAGAQIRIQGHRRFYLWPAWGERSGHEGKHGRNGGSGPHGRAHSPAHFRAAAADCICQRAARDHLRRRERSYGPVCIPPRHL